MLLIITGTICPKKQNNLTVSDTDERLKQYVDSIESYIVSGAFDKIVFCDNSNYECEKADKMLVDKALSKGVKLEILHFEGDSEKVLHKGKGYGEGEIMEYIFAKSTLLQEEPWFFKVTGRLQVHNIKELVNTIGDSDIYINIPNRNEKSMYDTRLYAIQTDVYKKYFLKAYESVDDGNGYYLEHVFADGIRNNSLKSRNFTKYPRITGVSGTSGSRYVYTEWKCKIKDFLSKFNYYGKTV